MMGNITLRTGKEVPEPLLRSAAMSLRALQHQQPMGVIELVECCRDASHRPFGKTGPAIVGWGLASGILADGTLDITPATRDIVLASFEGEDYEMRQVDPVTGA
jgi:hypothetical protein